MAPPKDPQKYNEWKIKIAATLTGRKLSQQHIENIRKGQAGKPRTTRGKTYEEIFVLKKQLNSKRCMS